MLAALALGALGVVRPRWLGLAFALAAVAMLQASFIGGRPVLRRLSLGAGVSTAVIAGAGAGTVLSLAGDAWADRAGGTSGALWGVALRAWGQALGDADKPSALIVAQGAQAAQDAIVRLGGAKVVPKPN